MRVREKRQKGGNNERKTERQKDRSENAQLQLPYRISLALSHLRNKIKSKTARFHGCSRRKKLF
jgi:hypothetical protein